MPETYTLHEAATCNGGMYLSHNFPSHHITEMASLPGVTAKNWELLMLGLDKKHHTIVNFTT